MPESGRSSYSWWKRVGFYLAMGPLEVYGRIRGVYRPRYGSGNWEVRNAPAVGQGPVVCFGDSLTEGFGAGPGQSYPAELARLLAPRGLEVLNLGRSGETTAEGLERITEVLELTPRPRVVVVGFGGNDLMQRRPSQEVFGNLEAMVVRLQEAGCVVVLLGLRGSWLYRVDYETPFHELAQRTGAALVPLCLDGIWGCPWRMSDAAHPNARGYRLLAQRVAAEVERVVGRVS